MIYIDYDQLSRVANVIRTINIPVNEFTNPDFFPPDNYDEEDVARFFFFTVAIDHRTGTYDNRFEGYVDGKYMHGSDLLYHLAVKRFIDDPDTFSPKYLSRITGDEIASWFLVDEPSRKIISDPNIRAYLLRDAAKKLIKLYSGKVSNIIAESKGFIYTRDGTGFIDRLKVFLAYSDPVEKKGFLLTKFLDRRRLMNIRDPENINLPIDNHLMRIAIRLGIVKPMEETKIFFIKRNLEVDKELDMVFRLVAKRAYRLLSVKAGVNPFILDDFLWTLGRERCQFNNPLCDSNNLGLINDACPLREVCMQYISGRETIMNEHMFLKTWYY